MKLETGHSGERSAVQGISASPGIAIGRAFVYGDILDEVETVGIDPSDGDAEIARFHRAVADVKAELERDADRIAADLGQDKADVFLVHSMILEDRAVVDAIEKKIRGDLVNAEAAVAEEMKRVARALSASDDAYLRDRAFDISDIGKRVIERMLGVWAHCPLSEPMVVVARELRASDTVSMDRGRVLGFVTEIGGREAHAAILARALGVPAVVGAREALSKVRTGDRVIVDGNAGTVIVDPAPEEIEKYEQRRTEMERRLADLGATAAEPAETSDGEAIRLLANIGTVEDAREARRLGAAGIGLFRTELVFMAAGLVPTEDEQFEIYRSVAEAVGDSPVTVRALDLGGDKFVGPENPMFEHNPYLGYRSIRVLLDRPEFFATQLRAILRAGVSGDLRILLPMISGVDELRAALGRLEEAKASLRRDGIPFAEDMPVGVMIEVPSAAISARRLAAECDFLSIGTNDLIQFTLAVDRSSAYVDHLYRPHDPGVIALIAAAVEGARSAGRPIAICGEMGGMPEYIPLLVGLGLREFSVAPGQLLFARKAIRATDSREAADLARQALELSTAADVGRLLGIVGDTRGPRDARSPAS